MKEGFADQVVMLARRSVVRTVRQPANVIGPLLFPMLLLAVNSGGLKAETHLPGFPTNSFVAFALAVPFIQGALFATMNAGTDLARDIQTGFLNRLALTPMRGIAVLAGQLGGVVALGLLQAAVYLAVGLAIGVHFASGVLGVLVLFAFSFLVTLGFGALGTLVALPNRLGRGGPGPLPALLRLPLHLVDEHAAQPDRRDLVPRRRDGEPGLLPDRVRPQPDHHRLGRRGARARVRRRDRDRRRGADAVGPLAAREDGSLVRLLSVARGVAWRTLHNVFTNPSLFVPSLLFPLFFFTAFAGGLSRVQDVPGFDFPDGYTAFQFVFVLLQSAAFGGVFTGFGIARDFETGSAGGCCSRRRTAPASCSATRSPPWCAGSSRPRS